MTPRALLEWAGRRLCLACGAGAGVHRIATIDGSRGKRLALLRTIQGVTHEFDPGERRRASR